MLGNKKVLNKLLTFEIKPQVWKSLTVNETKITKCEK